MKIFVFQAQDLYKKIYAWFNMSITNLQNIKKCILHISKCVCAICNDDSHFFLNFLSNESKENNHKGKVRVLSCAENNTFFTFFRRPPTPAVFPKKEKGVASGAVSNFPM